MDILLNILKVDTSFQNLDILQIIRHMHS